jgi:Fe-S cluster assembly protein SufD
MTVSAMAPAFLQSEKESLPAGLDDFRLKHWQAFQKEGLPTRKNEYWKYSDISSFAQKTFSPAEKMDANQLTQVIQQYRLQNDDSILMVLINGYFMPELSDMAKLPQNILVCGMDEAISLHEACISVNMFDVEQTEKFPFACLNAAKFNDGLFIALPDDCQLKAPLHLLSLTMGETDFMTHPRHMILLGQNSHCTFVEEYHSLENTHCMMNSVTTIHLEKQASLQHYKIQQAGKKATHLANHFVHQKQDSRYSHVNISKGAQFARDDVVVQLLEKGAECHTGGFYHLRDENQYIDNHIEINHIAPHSQSDMLYKGIVDNQSRAVFNGRLHVKQDAQHILAWQGNHNLLLSKQAEVYSKPELEIYADDVKCKHGATIGQLDQDALYYMCSRGISRSDAINILLQGFAEDILKRVTHSGIRERMQEAL